MEHSSPPVDHASPFLPSLPVLSPEQVVHDAACEVACREIESRALFPIDRREFLRLCSSTAAVLGLGTAGIPAVAQTLKDAVKRRASVVWLNFASDSGCTEALLKANYPNAGQLILETISLDFNETIQAAAGTQAEEILQAALQRGDYVLIIEGAIPTRKGFGMIARRDMINIAREFAGKARLIIAVGSCATWGGVPAGDPNPAGLKGVRDALGIECINLDLCPVNEGILVATIVDYLLRGKMPELDDFGRPKIFYGQTIHDQCERRAHFEAGRFVEHFGSKEEELGYCLYKVGCKGPMTYANCSKMRYNDRVSWCIGAGAPCIGCAEHGWVDNFADFYEHLPGVRIPGLGGVEAGADKIGIVAGIATATGIAAHAVGTALAGRFKKKQETDGKSVEEAASEPAPTESASETTTRAGETTSAESSTGGEKARGAERNAPPPDGPPENQA